MSYCDYSCCSRVIICCDLPANERFWIRHVGVQHLPISASNRFSWELSLCPRSSWRSHEYCNPRRAWTILSSWMVHQLASRCREQALLPVEMSKAILKTCDKDSKLWVAVLAQLEQWCSLPRQFWGKEFQPTATCLRLLRLSSFVWIAACKECWLIHFAYAEVPQGPRLRTEERSRPLWIADVKIRTRAKWQSCIRNPCATA